MGQRAFLFLSIVSLIFTHASFGFVFHRSPCTLHSRNARSFVEIEKNSHGKLRMAHEELPIGRRTFFAFGSLAFSSLLIKPKFSFAEEEELPPPVLRVIARFAPQLQFGVDFYLFELKDLLEQETNWKQIQDLFKVSGDSGLSVSRMEQDFFTPMSLLAQELEDFGGDDLIEDSRNFQLTMQDFMRSVELKDQIDSLKAWETGRNLLNNFITSLNSLQTTYTMSKIGKSRLDEAPGRETKYTKYKELLATCQQGSPLCYIKGYKL